MIRKTTCEKCGSTEITVTWKYKKEEETSLFMGHDGWGFQFEDAEIRCAKCKSQRLVNALYSKSGKIK
jgi:DNA-directed RNA polymerase subunit RPC12/RpoP